MITKIFSITLMALLFLAGCVPTDTSTRSVSPVIPTEFASDTPQISPADSAVLLPYNVVDTGQGKCYNNTSEIPCSQTDFTGQDAQFNGNSPSYTLNGDGLTVRDNVTGLIWQRSPDTNGDGTLKKSDKLTLAQAQALPAKLNAAKFGGYNDWRLPTIKQLYSLIDFRGTDPSGTSGIMTLTPFIDTTFFQFAYGDSQSGERTIDSQYASSTLYVNKSSEGVDKLFGVNFADGRIKGYDLSMPGGAEKTFFVICVRGNDQYGLNDYVDNGDQSITDNATGLTWAKTDSGIGMNWQDALAWVQTQNTANYLGHNDWRLPNIKELQSILDYSRSPDTTNSAAIDPIFVSTQITNEADNADYPFYWTGTTHAGSNGGGETADYIAFGRALGYMNNAWVDVHGAGAQRSDPKSGNASHFPQGRGPQGDAIRIGNFVRLVRGGNVTSTPEGNPLSSRPTMQVQATGNELGQSGGRSGPSEQIPGGQGVQNIPGGTPPQEAINSCLNRVQGSACSFTIPNRTVTGMCQTIQQLLVCVPEGRP